MMARLRTVLFAVAALTCTRIAYAQDINITIEGDPWKPSPMEARKQYLRGREADEMVRKGYVCYREVGSSECSWEKPERTTIAHWGKCEQSRGTLNGRICERITPSSSAWYFDFERPLVLLDEKIYDAQGYDPDTEEHRWNAVNPTVIKLRAAFLNKFEDISKRLTDEQQRTLERAFESTLKAARKTVFPLASVSPAGGKDGATASLTDLSLSYTGRRIRDEKEFGTDADFVCLLLTQSKETKSGNPQRVKEGPPIRRADGPSTEKCRAEQEEIRAADVAQRSARLGHELAEAAERSDKARANLETCEEKHRTDEFRASLGGQEQPSDSLDDEAAARRACKTAVEGRTEERRKTAASRPLRELLAIPEEYRLAEEVNRLALEEANNPGSTQAQPTTRRRSRRVEDASSAR